MADQGSKSLNEQLSWEEEFNLGQGTQDDTLRTFNQTNTLNKPSTPENFRTGSQQTNFSKSLAMQQPEEESADSSSNSATDSESSVKKPDFNIRLAIARSKYDPNRGGVDPIEERTLVWTLEVPTTQKPDRDEQLEEMLERKLSFIFPHFDLHRRPDE